MRKNPPTVELFEAHLLGKTPLGIYLLDDNEQVKIMLEILKMQITALDYYDKIHAM